MLNGSKQAVALLLMEEIQLSRRSPRYKIQPAIIDFSATKNAMMSPNISDGPLILIFCHTLSPYQAIQLL